MKRQLYYLLPDVKHTQQLCKDLNQMDIEQDHIHVVVNEKSAIDGIQDVHSLKEKDRDFYLEWFLWRLNLAVFVIGLLVFVVMAIWIPSYYLVIPIAIMAVTFLAGLYFTTRIPNVHWNESATAVHHGEVLLIVDVPVSEQQRIDHIIHQHHPEAINGGVCWKA